MGNANGKRVNIQFPKRESVSRWQRWAWLLKGVLLTPIYWLLAHYWRVPGLGFHLRCARLGLRLLLTARSRTLLGLAHNLMFLPMDSTRYFEFDFVWRKVSGSLAGNYLDVSSPRWFSLVFLDAHSTVQATLLNPDGKDLERTGRYIQAAGFTSRCVLENCLIQNAPFGAAVFDLITCISVIEHIPEDESAIRKMWDWLQPGGKLLLSVPCAAKTYEQYMDRNEYGLLTPDETGYVFWQRFYDETVLQEHIFRHIGYPTCLEVYGEKVVGSFQKNAMRKRAGPDTYPFWREAYMMGREYAVFQRINDLPGEGVVAMEFVKQ